MRGSCRGLLPVFPPSREEGHAAQNAEDSHEGEDLSEAENLPAVPHHEGGQDEPQFYGDESEGYPLGAEMVWKNIRHEG